MIFRRVPESPAVLYEYATQRVPIAISQRLAAASQAADTNTTPSGDVSSVAGPVTQHAEAAVIQVASVDQLMGPVRQSAYCFIGLRTSVPGQDLHVVEQSASATVKTVASADDQIPPVVQVASAKVSPAPIELARPLPKLRQYVDATTWPETGDLSAEEVGPVEQTVVGWSGWKYSLYLWPTDAVRQRVDAVVSPSMSPVGTPIGPVTQSAAATVTYKIGSNELRALSSKRTYATVVNPVEVTISQRLAPAENWAPISHNPGRLAIVRQTLPALRQSIRTNIIYRTIQIPVTRSASSDRVIIVIAQDTVLCETVSVAEPLVRVHI